MFNSTFCLWNSVYRFSVTLPGHHSVKIFALSSSLAFKAHIYLLSLLVQNVWVAIKKILTCLFGDENEQYFAINRSIAIHYCNAFNINSQSNLTLICDWSEMSKPWFFNLFWACRVIGGKTLGGPGCVHHTIIKMLPLHNDLICWYNVHVV